MVKGDRHGSYYEGGQTVAYDAMEKQYQSSYTPQRIQAARLEMMTMLARMVLGRGSAWTVLILGIA